jgi:predicted CoA-binding protein
MIDSNRVLQAAKSVLVIDWPLVEVPETLARAGYTTVEHGGPEPDNYSEYELRGGEVVTGRIGHPPDHADLVYTHRPVDELAEIVDFAKQIGASAVWIQSGLADGGTPDKKGCWLPEDESQRARQIVESAGMTYIQEPYIADAVRNLEPGK